MFQVQQFLRQRMEHQAQDLSIHSRQRSESPVQMQKSNPLLDFCNIILTYTKYPENFPDPRKTGRRVRKLGSSRGGMRAKGKRKSQGRPRAVQDAEYTPRQQKRNFANNPTRIKQKPGRKPKALKEGDKTFTETNVNNGSLVRVEDGRIKRRRVRKVSSPLNSIGESARESTHSSSSSSTSSHVEDRESQPSNLFYRDDRRDESWEEVTCFCGKPFAGRPMIECENCFVWHHMSCARLRRSNVPKKFFCKDCKPRFLDMVPQRPRRTSGNSCGGGERNNSVFHKTPMKGTGTKLSHPTLRLAPLNIPEQAIENVDNSINSSTPIPSLYLTPKEGNGTTQLSLGIKASPSKPASGRHRQAPYISNGNSTLNGHSTISLSENVDKSAEKPKRRPTLNSASTGLYKDEDILLPLRLTFGSISNGESSEAL